jgi:eukaryotic-like serine/threonine-protein kinase
MEPEAWARVKAVFHAALELPPRERAALLERTSSEDPALAAEIGELLAAHEAAGGFLEQDLVSLDPVLGAELAAALPGMRIGPYRVLGELGRGGMGAVFAAVRDDASFDQQVAIKLIKRGMDSEEIVRRFVAERQILARLVHPHIARLLDGGSTADGRPYFVMERIDGRPLPRYADEQGLEVEARLRLFLAVAEAVHFAHQNLVVHRDLKPANVLVTADGTPKLLDFGIAKLLDAEVGAGLTRAEARPRTPEYASPEQLSGAPVTTATDVYGLGLLLYELLAGVNPRESGGGCEATGEVRPASQLAARAGGELGRRRARRLAGDLDTILGRALAVDPARRYGSVRDLADDLERHLAHEPVRARRPTLRYRLVRFLRRYRLASASAAVVAALALVASQQAWRAAAQRDSAERQSRRAQALAQFLLDVFAVADPGQSRGQTVTVRELLDAGAASLEAGTATSAPRWLGRNGAALAYEPETRADLLHSVGEVYQNLGLREQAASALERSLALRAGLEGPDAELDAARTEVELAHLARQRGDHAAAEARYGRALAVRVRRLGPQSLEVAEVENGLGLLASARGDGVAARQHLARAIELARGAGAAGELRLAESLSNLAAVEITLGEAEAAAALLDEARALHQRLLGADHPRAAGDLSNLGGLLYTRGDFAGAAARFEEAVALRRRLLGGDHPHLAVALSNLATVELELDRHEAAEAHLREALAIQRRQPQDAGRAQADVAHALNNLASVVRERGRAVEAVALFEEALGLYRKLYGERHAMVATALHNLALAERDLARPAAAERRLREALALRREVLPAGHPALASTLMALATLLANQGRNAEARPLAEEGLTLRRRALPAGHASIRQAEALVARIGGPAS